jgi:hypothetical protein
LQGILLKDLYNQLQWCIQQGEEHQFQGSPNSFTKISFF